jgi:hypothetical protein
MGGSAAATIKTYPFHSSMRDLCQELKHSVVVPTGCRHCGRLIYLYANSDGVFVIFDNLGKPWARHLCGLIRATTREYYSLNLVFSPHHRLPVPHQVTERNAEDGQSLCGSVVAIDKKLTEVFDGTHRYWVTPSHPLRLGQAVRGAIHVSCDVLVLEVTDEPTPSSDDLTASEKVAAAAEGKVMDITKHNETTQFFARAFKKGVKIVWGVFSNTNHLVAVYDLRVSQRCRSLCRTANRGTPHHILRAGIQTNDALTFATCNAARARQHDY